MADASLTDASAAKLASGIANGKHSAREVVDAHIERCERVEPKLNATTFRFFDQARNQADRIDQRRAAGEPLGMLAGAPITIKDCYALPGGETTLGVAGFSAGADCDEAPLVKRLRAAGAIVIAKTNVPQAMLLHECANPLHGRTNHPLRDDRSPGGSSGGEAALVASGVSKIGLASDLGGSIRQPAAACGVFGFMPSPGVLVLEGSRRAISSGMQSIAIQPGPIAGNAGDLRLAMQVLSGGKIDREPNRVAGKRFVAWTDNGVFRPAVGMARAVETAEGLLRSAGAEVVFVDPPDTRDVMRLYLGLVSADGMAAVRRVIRRTAKDPQLARQLRLARLPRIFRNALAPLATLLGQRETADLLRWSGPRSADAYWEATIEARQYAEYFWRDVETKSGGRVDAVLHPPYGLPALRHGTALHLLRAASHTFLANLLAAPAGVAPVGCVTPEAEAAELEARSRPGLSISERFARRNAEGSKGLPTAVEVLARTGDDAWVLDALSAIEDGAT